MPLPSNVDDEVFWFLAPAATALGAEYDATAGNTDANPFIVAVTIALTAVAIPVAISTMAVAVAPIMGFLHQWARRGDVDQAGIGHPRLSRRRRG